MKISGNDLLPFTEAKAAINSNRPHVAGINIHSYNKLRGTKTILVDEHIGPSDFLDWECVGLDDWFVPVRCIKSSAIKRLGLDQRPIGVYP
jgi:hypothetical protein